MWVHVRGPDEVSSKLSTVNNNKKKKERERETSPCSVSLLTTAALVPGPPGGEWEREE
jgi:hypothetical protein